MPELPEVETVRGGLRHHLLGRTIEQAEVLHPRATRRQGANADFMLGVTGRRIEAIRRRGKYLWFALDSGDAIVAHLGMSGQFRFVPPGTKPHVHLRIRLTLGPEATLPARECWFLDQRTFGGMHVSPGGADLPPELAHIGRDLLDPEADLEAIAARIRRKDVGIKRVLLDQTVTSGIGNIYADEALWRSRLHFARVARRLTRRQVLGLLGDVRAVFDEALAAGGTSFDALYVDVNGESGRNSLNVYGQEGRPCKRCGTPIVRERFMNRSSHLCPRCQRRR